VVNGLKLYQQLLTDRRYLDYSAIMLDAVKAISQITDLKLRLGERIRHVIVDEYQDVNPIQECVVSPRNQDILLTPSEERHDK
jgi:DNA helicase-2/ATP-dependent DNA helicase PcrA